MYCVHNKYHESPFLFIHVERGGRETYSLLDSMHNVGEQNKTCSRLIIRDVPSDNVEVRLSPLMSVPFACFQQPSSLLVPSPGGYL